MDSRGRIRVEFDAIATLPEAAIAPGSLIGDAFLQEGVRTFHGACRWVHGLAYGRNAAGGDCAAVFSERQGTCVTKHGLIAKLAAELGLDVHKAVGFYRLDDAIVTGVGAILRPYDLPFVPQMHCFLESGDARVDLTEGNTTGKNGTIDVYDFIVRVPPEPAREELQRLYAEYLPRYASIEPRLGALPASTLDDLLRACGEAQRLQLQRRREAASGMPGLTAVPAYR